MEKKYKYVHILWRDEVKFNKPLIQMICDSQNGFCVEDHVFITPHADVYEALNEYGNVKLDKSGKNLFNRYGEYCDWIISHSFNSIFDILTTKKKILHKIIWRSWGGRISGFTYYKGQPLRNLVKRIINRLYLRRVDQFAAIGYANVVDVLDIRKIFPNISLYRMPYAARENYQNLLDASKDINRHDDYVHVLLGHRGMPEGRHIDILETLQKYKSEKMKIFIPLSYGDKAYIEKVKAFIKKMELENVVVLEEMMPYKDYLKILNDMDLAIFDGADSYALGNISILLRFKKKIFLRRDGVIAEAFIHENTPFIPVDEIQNMDFYTFSEPITYLDGTTDSFVTKNYEDHLKRWQKILDDFS